MVQVNLGQALTEQAKRTEGAAGTEVLVRAITVFRSGLEVGTRNQSPQAWAEIHKHFGNALKEHVLRTGGVEGKEVLGQAVAAYRSALEVYTREAFPFYHEQAEHDLEGV
jgi:hypothetical protein